ncbi:TonB-dependent receptor [Sphingomonas sp. Sphisp140]|uniref:TonB-dependent receptor n=1 Tax=unclassified Sphingomonas TaxID=196159 RepID=UPI0039B0A453
MTNQARFLLATTSALGLMIIPNIAVSQEAPGAVPAQQNGESGEIVVTAIRRSLETAAAIKQNSDQMIDSVVAEDIGKLPDVTAAESLARITGIQVDRAQGEASGTRLRGLPDLTTTYNGREIFTAEGRAVALQDFPSASIARIDVYKSASANLIEPGIAGLIDVRSRMPFDFKTGRIAGSVTGVHWYQSQKLGLDANLLVSQRWNTGLGEMGLLIEGSYADVNFLDSSRNVSQSILYRTTTPGSVAAPIRYPSFVNIDYATAKRWRPSAHASYQWRPSSNLEIYLDGLFQGFRGRGSGRNLTIGSGVAANLSNVTYFPGTNLVQSMTATAGALPTGQQNAIDANTDTYQFGGGFVWKADRLKVTGDVAWTDSTYTQNNLNFNYTLTTQPTRTFNFDTPAGAGGGVVTLTNFDLFNPSLYRLTTFTDSGTRTHGRDIQARLDFDYALGDEGITNLQAGIRFNSRDADSRAYTRTGTAPANQFFSVLPLEYSSVPGGFRGDEAETVRSWLTPTRDSIIAQVDYLRTLTGLTKGRPGWNAPTYTGNEKAYAGYVQARCAFDIGVPVDGLIGLRAVRTEDQINGTATVTTAGVTTNAPIARDNSYTDFLPNVSARLKFSRELQLRVAFTKTRTRPGFGSLNPSVTVGAPSTICATEPTSADCLRTASGGNPDLKPIESTNYDASWEYYFTRDGSITLGAFHRDLTGFINSTTTQVIDPTYGRLNITRPENGGKGHIRGIEAGFRTFFRAPWLPKWTRDFGVLANYTYLDHKSELAPTLAKTLPGMQPLSGVSKHLANASIFYENRFLSLRAAYNYRSDFVVSYGQVADPALNNALGPTLPVKEKGRGTLDLSATLNPTSKIAINFSVSNLLGTAATNSRQFDYNSPDDVYPWQTRFLESVYRLGVRFRL